MRRFIILPLTAAAAAVMLGLTARSARPSDAGSVEDDVETIILDVRTAEEFASGHLEGAEMLDFNGGEVAAALPTLDPGAEYLVYCRSGNRSGQAVALMQQAGFTNLTNLGSLEQAAQATGIAIIR